MTCVLNPWPICYDLYDIAYVLWPICSYGGVISIRTGTCIIPHTPVFPYLWRDTRMNKYTLNPKRWTLKLLTLIPQKLNPKPYLWRDTRTSFLPSASFIDSRTSFLPASLQLVPSARCCNRSQVSGSRFRVSGFGFRVSGLGFRVSGFGFKV